MDDILSWGRRHLRLLWFTLLLLLHRQTWNLHQHKIKSLQMARLWFFFAASQGAGFPHMCSVLRAALVSNQALGLSPGAWSASSRTAWVLKTGKHFPPRPQDRLQLLCPLSLQFTLAQERQIGRLGLTENWGLHPTQSPAPRQKLHQRQCGPRSPPPHPSTLRKSVPGATEKKSKCRHK